MQSLQAPFFDTWFAPLITALAVTVASALLRWLRGRRLRRKQIASLRSKVAKARKDGAKVDLGRVMLGMGDKVGSWVDAALRDDLLSASLFNTTALSPKEREDFYSAFIRAVRYAAKKADASGEIPKEDFDFVLNWIESAMPPSFPSVAWLQKRACEAWAYLSK